LPLLEVSEDLTARYAQQAQAADRELLIKGLDKLAQCDTQYRNSKEPRLLVELTLIQLCRLGANAPVVNGIGALEKKSPDVTSAPPAPQRSTPAVASTTVAEPAPSVRQQTAPVAVVAQKMAATTPAAQASSAPSSVPIDAPDSYTTGNGSAPVPAPRQTAPVASPKSTAYVPKRRLLVDQVSISQPVTVAVPVEKIAELSDEDAEGPASAVSTREVNHSLLVRAWEEFALQRKKEGRTSIYATLTDREPKVAGLGRVSFSIVNDVQENYLKSEKPELLGHLRRSLGDPGLELEVIKEEAKVQRRFTIKDRFDVMAEKNPALNVLRDSVDLDLG
jgi:DNA polymerase III subunit gamma/tau